VTTKNKLIVKRSS